MHKEQGLLVVAASLPVRPGTVARFYFVVEIRTKKTALFVTLKLLLMLANS
jgi:hypothetical protein